MSAPRPTHLVIGALALAGFAKTGLMLSESGSPRTAPRDSFFVSAANAASGATEDAEQPQAAPAPPKGGNSNQCELPEEILATVSQERALLDEQKASLAQRASEIQLAEETLAIETARLGELKTEVEGLLGKIDASRQADIDRLVGLYTNMKPKEAAVIMNDLDIEVAVTVLGAMSERNAAPIMASMNTVRAQAISMIILERSKLPGDQRLNGIRLQ